MVVLHVGWRGFSLGDVGGLGRGVGRRRVFVWREFYVQIIQLCHVRRVLLLPLSFQTCSKNTRSKASACKQSEAGLYTNGCLLAIDINT